MEGPSVGPEAPPLQSLPNRPTQALVAGGSCRRSGLAPSVNLGVDPPRAHPVLPGEALQEAVEEEPHVLLPLAADAFDLFRNARVRPPNPG